MQRYFKAASFIGLLAIAFSCKLRLSETSSIASSGVGELPLQLSLRCDNGATVRIYKEYAELWSLATPLVILEVYNPQADIMLRGLATIKTSEKGKTNSYSISAGGDHATISQQFTRSQGEAAKADGPIRIDLGFNNLSSCRVGG